MSASTVHVAVRIRGLNENERKGKLTPYTIRVPTTHPAPPTSLVTMDPENGEEKEYLFDYVFDHSHPYHPLSTPQEGSATPGPPPLSYDLRDADHHTIHEAIGKPAIRAFTEECRSTSILVYGETGTGKTTTLIGKSGIPKLRGLMFRVCKDILDQNATNATVSGVDGKELTPPGQEDDAVAYTEQKVEFGIQALELYNEMLNDLLTNRTFWPTGGHRLRFNRTAAAATDGTFDCSTIPPTPCANYPEVEDCILRADRNRFSTLHQTCRAHVIYRLIRTTTITTVTQSEKRSVTISNVDLNFVDLAGSERPTASAARGCMLREGPAINAALSHLLGTIRTVRDGGHVPYRNSKLTMLLQQSIAKGHVALLATVSPASTCYRTLRCASALRKEDPPRPEDGGPKTTINDS